MTIPTPQEINLAIHKNAEVLEAICARKGYLYAARIEMFVACTKMQVQCFGPDRQVALGFALQLVEAFDIPMSERAEFIDNCEAVRRAQSV